MIERLHVVGNQDRAIEIPLWSLLLLLGVGTMTVCRIRAHRYP